MNRPDDSDPVPVRIRTLRLVVLLVAIDVVFLLLHASHVRFDVPGSGLWLISRDRGFPEIFQYLKEALIVLMLLWLHRQRASLIYLSWALVFSYLLLDDSLRIHETLGDGLVSALGLEAVAGIEAKDLGQVIVSATAGVVLLGFAGLATLRDRSPARGLSILLGFVMVALVFFGVVTDVIDAIDLFGLVEDGGEMVAMSFGVAITAHHYLTRGGDSPIEKS